MQELFETVIRRGLTDNARRKLVISPQVISFENRDLAGNTFTSFFQNEVEAFRFGINWIQYHFTFGRQYIIEIKNKEGKIMRITFSSYFRRNLNELHKKYTDILDALCDYHFGAITDRHLSLHKNEVPFTIGKVNFSHDGITMKVDNTLKHNEVMIPWEKVRTQNYYTYFAIYSEDDARHTNTVHSYKEDWNTNVLYSVLRTILKAKNIETYS